jgi:glycosyltransferase involved in cell wall biosynthesis
MKIVINAIPLIGPLTGVGTYLCNIVTEIERLSPNTDFRYFYGNFTRKFRYGEENNTRHEIKEFIKRIPVISSVARELNRKLATFHFGSYDVYFEPNFVPLGIRARKTVVTVHDFSFHLHPEWLPDDRLKYFSKHFFENIKRADTIIVPSEHIRKQATELLEGSSARVVTIFVGSIEPRKNLFALLKAYMALPKYIKDDFTLLLVGFKGWNNGEVMSLLGKLEGNVQYLGYVASKELAHLYRGASCFVYPSLYEGFGIPPLEAMASGCPVVVSNAASLPEVCGDAAYYVDPKNPDSITGGLQAVLTNETLRKGMVEKGIGRASNFSWERSAMEHLRVFSEVLKS